ncbi:MAG: site-specific integrase [Clostridiales bacterium]|jgi:integrase|nr:site-specific integrase [Clostridiales bacterium]
MYKKIKVYDMYSLDELLSELNGQDGSISDKNKERINMLLEIKGVSVDKKPRKDGRYQGRVMIDGKYTSVYAKTREEVIFKLQRILKGEKPPTKKKAAKEWRLHEWLDFYIENFRLNKLNSAKSKDEAFYIANRLKKLFSDRPLKALPTEEIQLAFNGIKGTAQQRVLLFTLNSAYEKAALLKHVKNNPCAAVDLRPHRGARKTAMSNDEQRIFLQALAAIPDDGAALQYKLLFFFVSLTGTRIGEALAVTKPDFVLGANDFGTVSINKTVTYTRSNVPVFQSFTKTAAGMRTVPLPNAFIVTVLNYARNTPDNDRIFSCTYRSAYEFLKSLLKKLGIQGYSVHTLRHNYSTRLKETGTPGDVRQKLLGHSNISTTENTYTDTQAEYISRYNDNIYSFFDTVLTQFSDQKPTQNAEKDPLKS